MKEVEKKGKRIRTEEVILKALTGTGILALAAIAPNLISTLKKLDVDWKSKIDPRQRVSQTLYRLKKRGLITITRSGVSLTQAGAGLLEKLEIGTMRIRRPLRWDQRWRLVIFDIAEKRRRLRNQLRTMLMRIGFVRLQDSVWVYPYDCEEVIGLLKAHSMLGREVLYVIADVIENDAGLRRHFSL